MVLGDIWYTCFLSYIVLFWHLFARHILPFYGLFLLQYYNVFISLESRGKVQWLIDLKCLDNTILSTNIIFYQVGKGQRPILLIAIIYPLKQ